MTAETTKEGASVIARVETFIQRLHALEYIISQRASELNYSNTKTGEFVGNLSDRLAKSLVEYEMGKNKLEKLVYARSALIEINRAFTNGVIQESEGMARKLRECQTERSKLEKELQILSAEYQALKGERDAFTRIVQPLDKKDKSNSEE